MSHQPKLHHVPVNGLSLAGFEWRAPLRGIAPTLWMVHATGFHGRVWDQVIHHLPGRHVIAVEQRGHGRSSGTGFDSWADFGRDQAAMAAALDLQRRGGHRPQHGRACAGAGRRLRARLASASWC